MNREKSRTDSSDHTGSNFPISHSTIPRCDSGFPPRAHYREQGQNTDTRRHISREQAPTSGLIPRRTARRRNEKLLSIAAQRSGCCTSSAPLSASSASYQPPAGAPGSARGMRTMYTYIYPYTLHRARAGKSSGPEWMCVHNASAGKKCPSVGCETRKGYRAARASYSAA